MKRPMASLFDSVLPPTAIHHRMSMLSITCAAWSPMCQGAGQQSHTLLLAGTADGWLWAWQRSAPTVYGNGQAPTPHVLVRSAVVGGRLSLLFLVGASCESMTAMVHGFEGAAFCAPGMPHTVICFPHHCHHVVSRLVVCV